ncbi:MAG: HPr family phosphocarrier protein [Clostridia bacterium]|nr:HPr family phosphocarrier protein [Clostridia bacterium]
MKRFDYVITDALGIHARPAGLLVREAQAFPDTVITISKDGNAARATQLMRVMGLGVRQGDTVTVTAEGAAETDAARAMRTFFSKYL